MVHEENLARWSWKSTSAVPYWLLIISDFIYENFDDCAKFFYWKEYVGSGIRKLNFPTISARMRWVFYGFYGKNYSCIWRGKFAALRTEQFNFSFEFTQSALLQTWKLIFKLCACVRSEFFNSKSAYNRMQVYMRNSLNENQLELQSSAENELCSNDHTVHRVFQYEIEHFRKFSLWQKHRESIADCSGNFTKKFSNNAANFPKPFSINNADAYDSLSWIKSIHPLCRHPVEFKPELYSSFHGWIGRSLPWTSWILILESN